MKVQNWLVMAAIVGLGWGCDKPEEAPTAQPAEVAKEEVEAPTPAVEPAAAAAEAATTATVGKVAPDFELKDETGKAHKLSDYKGKIVVLEWTSPECPYVVRHYDKDTMQTSWDKLGNDKVVWLAVDSSNFVTPESATEWKGKEGFKYPVLQDPAGDVGKLYEAKTTPHMYVIDAEGTLRYAGAIDNDPRGKEEKITNYVEEAVSALLEGKEVPTSNTQPYGCSVKYKS